MFCVGLGALGGAVLKLSSTALLGSSVVTCKSLRFLDPEAIESSNLLGGFLSIRYALSRGRDEKLHMRKWMRNNAAIAARVLELAFMVLGERK